MHLRYCNIREGPKLPTSVLDDLYLVHIHRFVYGKVCAAKF